MDAPARGPSVPPVYALVALLVMGAFHLGFPIARIFPPPYHYAGLVLMGLAIGLILWAALHFRRLRTAIIPFQPSTALVTSGPYRFTRNPMYLGMALIYVGAALLFDLRWALLLLPLVLLVIQTRVIALEERYLEAKFGDEYRAYRSRVRRWL